MVTFVQARNHGGTQSSVNRIVIHGTVSHTTSREASAHYVVDQAHVIQCLSESTIAWQAPPNTGAIGIELCDPQKGSASRWRDPDHEAMLHLAAKLTYEIAGRWHVPLYKLTATQLRAGKRGVCGHADVSAAWHLTDHIDPGTGFPWAHFMDLLGAAPHPSGSSVRAWPGTLFQLKTPMMRGEAEKWIQQRLNAKGASPKLAADGVFGAKTDREVRDYQHAHKLAADGIVGRLTWGSLAK